MARKSKSLLFLVLVVGLLVVISSRVSPKQALKPNTPTVTDDPLPVETTEQPVSPNEPETTPSPPPGIRELLPGVSPNDWNLRLVNNTYILANTFAPNVSPIRDNQYFESRAVEPLEQMLTAAEEAGYTVCVRAAYRPFSTQAYIFNGRASQIQWGTTMSLMDAEMEARKVVAYPGTSEHQLGLCADIMDSEETKMAADSAESIPLLQWLKEHCSEYGFILRYPKEKQEITGWNEPWHFRYVGEDAAKYMMDNNLCLEEFIALF